LLAILPKMKNEIINTLKENDRTGLSITELAKKLKLSRFIVKNYLLELQGAEKVFVRKAGMAKIYFLRSDKKWLKK